MTEHALVLTTEMMRSLIGGETPTLAGAPGDTFWIREMIRPAKSGRPSFIYAADAEPVEVPEQDIGMVLMWSRAQGRRRVPAAKCPRFASRFTVVIGDDLTPTVHRRNIDRLMIPDLRPLRQRQPRVENPAYLKKIRLCCCLRCGLDPCREAAHLRMTGQGKENPGVGAKPDDAWALPLCHMCHVDGPESQHSMGEERFWQKVGLDPIRLARSLYKLKDSLDAMRARVFAEVDQSPWV